MAKFLSEAGDALIPPTRPMAPATPSTKPDRNRIRSLDATRHASS